MDLLLHFATSTATEQGTREQAIDAQDEEDTLTTALREVPADAYPQIAALGAAELMSGPGRLSWGFGVLINGILQTPGRTQKPRWTAKASHRLTKRLRLILAVVLIADVFDLMDSTITNIAAPAIVRDIGGGESLIKWLGASYALAMGVLLVIGGRLGDRYGKRRMFLIGIAGFTLASLWCGLAADPAMLIAGRLVQGGFGALLIPQGFGILIATFSRAQFPRAVSAFGPVLGVSAVLGPIVAGFVISANIAGLGWRPIFWINIVLGTMGFAAARRLLPRDRPAGAVSIDGLGSGLLGASMFALIYGLIEGSTAGWTAIPIACLAFFAAVNGLAYVLSLFFQTALGLTPDAAAIALSPLMAGIILASLVCRPLIPRLGRRLVIIGLGFTLAGAAGLWATVLADGIAVSVWAMAPSIAVLGVGMGACFSSIFDIAVGDVAAEEAGSASGTLSASPSSP